MSTEKLIKCLEMMSSEHDGEALAAARKAQKILTAMGKRWPDVISANVSSPQNRPAPTTPSTNTAPDMTGMSGFGSPFGNPYPPHDPRHAQWNFISAQTQQQYNPFSGQQYQQDPFAQQQTNYFNEALRQQAAYASELRRQEAAMEEIRKANIKAASEEELKKHRESVDSFHKSTEEVLKDRTEKKRRSFWVRSGTA